MLERRIIDCHLHIGTDSFWDIKGDLNEYVKSAKEIGVTDSLVMPVPCPLIQIENYHLSGVFAGIFGKEPDEWETIQEITSEDEDYGVIPPQQNPYQIANLITSMNVLANTTEEVKLHFVPLVHPCYDSVEYWEHVAYWYEPVAIKVHGLSSVLKPKDIPDEFWKFVYDYRIPLIVHTDVYRGEKVNDLTNIYRNYNTPLEWLRILQEHEVRAYLAHGARLCEESIRIINDSSNFIVGLGPDSRLSTQKDQLYSDEPYLEKLFDLISIDKVCFDTDYPYNTLGSSDTELEWKSIDRIKALGLTDEELAKVLYVNASKFFYI